MQKLLCGRPTLILALGSAVLIALAACGGSGPAPEIVGQQLKTGLVNLDYTVWVDCTVRNSGAEGDVELTATLDGGGSWKKRKTLYVGSEQETAHQFEFREPEFLAADRYEYQCEARPK